MPTTLLTLAALLTLSPKAPHPSLAAPPPCTHAAAACKQWVLLGGGPARTLVYASYPLDKRNPAITRALVMVHGAGRNADHYFETSTAAAFLAGALENTIIVAPRFAAGNDAVEANEVKWPERGGNWRSGGAPETLPNVTSFDFMDQLLRMLADKKVFPNLKRIVVAGHSAGGQFVTRYEMANTVHGTLGDVEVSYVVANPSSYAWPTAERPLRVGDADPALADRAALGPTGEEVHTNYRFGPVDTMQLPRYNNWPAGLAHRTGYAARLSEEQLRRQLVERPTTYLLGQVDVLPLGGFDASPNAMAQGPTRRARGEAFFKYVTEKLGAKHQAIIVPECGHNDRCVFTTDKVFPVLFPDATSL
ncbi:MAG: alpha/beta fold hydrolase [Gemmatimonadetes bacterium]|nr:alpha/beta fold hydrolase [Gemmatimonadota bacterium]